jgi:hypothetical protein
VNPKRYTCPCCGYQTFDEPPGSFDICPICFWEDDNVQLLDPWYAGGANVPSLVEAQENFQECGASDERLVDLVRGIQPDDRRDPEWRTVEAADQRFVQANRGLPEPGPEDLNGWYYWRDRNPSMSERTCPTCGRQAEPGWSSCPQCGAALPVLVGEEEDEVRDPHRGEELDWDPGGYVLGGRWIGGRYYSEYECKMMDMRDI